MFNIKRLFFLFVLIISILFSLQNIKIVFSVLRETLSGKDFSILLIAWPLVLGWLIYTSIFICLIIFSWSKIQEIDKMQVSKSGVSPTQTEDKMFSSVRMSPIVKFGIYFGLIILAISILASLSK